MISVEQLNEVGIRVGFSSGGWTLHKGNLLLAQGPKVHSLYPLYVTFREGDLFLVDIPMSSLWHGQLGHLSKAGITHLSRAGYILKLSFSDHQFCEHCQYGKQVATSHPTSAPRESVARCHISLSAVLRTSSVLLTTRLGRCGLTLSEPKIGCSRYLRLAHHG